ncbi:MAG: hypothetical protein Kow00124_23470 [Anaerolineae bacterium]
MTMRHRVNVQGYWLVSVDRAATTAAYAALPAWGGLSGCDTPLCENFRQAYSLLPPAFLSVLITMGVDPAKPAELYDVEPPQGGACLCGGWYHAVGELLAGRDALQPGQLNRYEVILREVSAGFRMGITARLAALPGSFPAPALQIEFWGQVPWVIASLG